MLVSFFDTIMKIERDVIHGIKNTLCNEQNEMIDNCQIIPDGYLNKKMAQLFGLI